MEELVDRRRRRRRRRILWKKEEDKERKINKIMESLCLIRLASS